MQATLYSKVVRIGSFLLDLESGDLLNQGRRLRLGEEPFRVLEMLVAHHGQAVTREDLERGLWPNDTVAESGHSIDAALKRLRDVLADNAENPRYVETLPRRGYRLMCPVEVVDEGSHAGKPALAATPASTPTSDFTGRTISHYSVYEEIGRGGMGVVYRAEDIQLTRPVAMKFLLPDLIADGKAVARFQREARMASALSHPNICTIHEIGEHEGCPFITMELLKGQTLKRRLSGQPLDLDEIVRISQHVAAALESAHDRGIIHRDIKPANIFLTSNGITKIVDFGLAKPVLLNGGAAHDGSTNTATDTTDSGNLTTSGVAVGTRAYMSPEQLRGETLDARTDLFSFGSVLYEMATGRQAFEGKTDPLVSEAILNRDPEPPEHLNPHISPTLAAIIKKALAKDRAKRYSTAAELRADLRTLAGNRLGFWSWGRIVPWLRWAPVMTVLLASLAVGLYPHTRHWLMQRIWSPPIPAKRGVAVLPFKAAGAGAEDQTYCLGLSEAATDKLTLLTAGPNLQVTPATDVLARGIASVGAARAELGANLVFLGNCSQSGNTIRVSLALVDTGASRPLRSDTITGQTAQPFALHDDVVNAMTRMLALELAPSQQQAVMFHGTQVPGAYTLYLLGRGYLMDLHRLESVDKAISFFERALELDANYARAFAGLGVAFWDKYKLTKEKSWVETARLSCERAILADQKLAEGQICTGTVLNGTGEYEKARTAYQAALELESTNDAAYRGLAFSQEHLGQTEAAEQTYLQAIKLRPDYWPGYTWAGDFYFRHTRYAEAIEMFKKVTVLTPESSSAHNNLGGIYLAMGRYAEAISVLNRAVALRPSPASLSNLGIACVYQKKSAQALLALGEAVKLDEKNAEIWGYLAWAYYWAPGERPKSTEAYQKAVALGEEELMVNRSDSRLLRQIAVDYAMLGERQTAFAYLSRARLLAPHDADLEFQAAAIHARFGEDKETLDCLDKAVAWGSSRTTIFSTPDFDRLHADLRFQRLIQEP